MIKIDAYTGVWQAALRPAAPKGGKKIIIRDYADARELFEFKDCLRIAGLRTNYTSIGDKYEVVLLSDAKDY